MRFINFFTQKIDQMVAMLPFPLAISETAFNQEMKKFRKTLSVGITTERVIFQFRLVSLNLFFYFASKIQFFVHYTYKFSNKHDNFRLLKLNSLSKKSQDLKFHQKWFELRKVGLLGLRIISRNVSSVEIIADFRYQLFKLF